MKVFDTKETVAVFDGEQVTVITTYVKDMDIDFDVWWFYDVVIVRKEISDECKKSS